MNADSISNRTIRYAEANDASIIQEATMAFSFEKEDYKKLLWVIPQRFIYRQLMYYILIKSFNRALKGELQEWGVLKRTGNVNEVVPA
jgi:hypothetical protein